MSKELAEVARAALDYIDALPNEVVAALPVMPGFDRDWADETISESLKADNEARLKSQIEALEQQLSEERTWHRHTKDKLANALIRNSHMAGELGFHFNPEKRLKPQGN